MNGIKAVLFDVNGTLVDIRTEENDAVFRAVANVLSYSGVALRRAEVRAAYADLMAEQRAACGEEHPSSTWSRSGREVVERHATGVHPRAARGQAGVAAAAPRGDPAGGVAAATAALPVRPDRARRPGRALPARGGDRRPERVGPR